MIIGPAMFPMLWFIAKGLWGEYHKRPPLWLSYEPEQFPEVTYYDTVCDVVRPEVFGGCEDIRIIGDYAIVSCDPYLKQSNFFTGFTPNTPSGAVYIWNYVTDDTPTPIELPADFGEFRPRGVHARQLTDSSKIRLFLSNAAYKNASVEVFDFDPATKAVVPFASLHHEEAILDPAAIVSISDDQIFLTNTLGWPYSTLGIIEALSGFPFGSIGYMNLTDMTNITGKSIGVQTTPVGIEYVDEWLYVTSLQYGVYGYQLYIPPNDLDPELVAENKSLGRMHFYPGERVYRTPYLPTHLSYSEELGGIVSAAIPSYSGEIKAWYGRKSASWAGLLVDRAQEDGKPLVVADSVTSGLRSNDRKWQTLFWDKTGENFSGLKSMTIANGRRFGVSPHQAGVLICKTNGLEPVEVPEKAVDTEEQKAQTKEKRSKYQLEHLNLAKDEL
ncbi:hypothetical protein BZA70DRAFT_97104 [Myxozyma melibiosi]|uniref:Uncharacterized protein n=1 Tax=Myxozyma melibiosi TaxID=54550 RepID=A0ABR1F076_9ASCO